jgi:DNA-binding GntR family transcriptional regulator
VRLGRPITRHPLLPQPPRRSAALSDLPCPGFLNLGSGVRLPSGTPIFPLGAQRLIEATAHRGPGVVTLTPKLVPGIYDSRADFEVLLVRSYTTAASKQDLAELKGILRDLTVVGKQLGKSSLVEIITRFLRHRVTVVDNQVVVEIFDQVLARINLLRMMSMSVPGQIEESIIRISGLVDHIAAHDAIGEKIRPRYTAQTCSSALKQLKQETIRMTPGSAACRRDALVVVHG